MADAFNLTAQLNLRGPNNIKTVVADIRRQLGTVNASLNFKIDPAANNNIAKLNGTLRTFNSTLAQTQTSATSAAQAISNLGRAVNSVNVRNLPQQVNASANAINKMSSSAVTTTKTVQQTATAVEELGKQSYLAVKRFAAFTIPTAAVFGLTNAVNKGVAAFIEYDKEFVKLQQITGESANGLQNLSKTITSLATGLGVASSDITSVASTLAQAGLSARDTERALKALALSNLAPSFDSMNETVEGSIALMRQFGISAGDLEGALGSINSVAAKFAVEASDIITAIQRTGGVFATASKGVSEGKDALNEFIAVFTSVRATTRESAETIATGLRTIFTRIQRGDTIEALKEYGVNLTDLDGKFVGAYKAVELLSKGLSKLDPRDLKFSQIVEELGGFRQIGKVIPLIQQFATAQDALKVAQRGQGSLAADAAKAQESLANKITKVREEFFALFREIGNSQGFQSIIRGALDLSSALIKVADSIKGILPALTIFAAFKGVSALTQFGTGFIGAARARKAEGGPVYKFQRGGVVPGSGSGDTVPALLEPGEVVINNAAANAYGRNNLIRMNKYASGGRSAKKRIVFDNNTKGTLQASHIGGDVVLSKRELQQYASEYNNKQFQRAIQSRTGYSIDDIKKGNFNFETVKSALGLKVKERVRLNMPSVFNQALKTGNPDLVSQIGLIQYINTSSNLLTTKNNTQNIKQQLKKKIASLRPRTYSDSNQPNVPAFDNDYELNQLKDIIDPKGTQTNKLDIMFVPALQDAIYRKVDSSTKESIGPIKIRRQSRTTALRSKINKYLGVKIQNFKSGGALGARSKFKELSQEEIFKLSTPELIAYGKALARDIFTTGGAGMAVSNQFIEVPQDRITPELEPYLKTYAGKKGFWREKIAPFGRPSKKLLKTDDTKNRQKALAIQTDRYADEVAARDQRWTSIRSGSPIDNYLLKSLQDPILSDYITARSGKPLNKAFHDTRLRQAVNKALEKYDDFDYSAKSVDKLVSGMAAKRFDGGGIIQSFADGGLAKAILAKIPSPAELASGPYARGSNIPSGQSWRDILKQIFASKGIAYDAERQRVKLQTDKGLAEVSLSDTLSSRTLTAANFRTKVGSSNVDELSSIRDLILRKYSTIKGDLLESSRERTENEVKDAQSKDLFFGAVGMLGNEYRNKPITISKGLTSPVDAIVSGYKLDEKIGRSIDKGFSKDISKSVRKAARKTMINQIISDVVGGNKLFLDFDRTLAFGADKILKDPNKPQFSEFSDRNKVSQALTGARLSNLGRSLVGLIKKSPGNTAQDLLSSMNIISARPKNTLDLVQKWLASQGLPIPLSQFSGVGGPSVTEEDVARLKASLIPSGSSFVDDNSMNIEAAQKAGIRSYQYSFKRKTESKDIATTKGISFQEMIRYLGGPDPNPNKQSIDFPSGIGAAAKYFRGIDPRVPTDAKRTISGPSDLKDNIKNYLIGTGRATKIKKDAAKFAFGGSVDGPNFEQIKNQILKKYPEIDFRISKRKSGFGYMIQAGLSADNRSQVNFASNLKDLSNVSDKIAQDILYNYGPNIDPKLLKKLQKKKFASGGIVPAMVSNGEAYVSPETAKSIGYAKLHQLNRADSNGMQNFASGGISIFKGPGSGTSDSIGPIGLPEGSFILREKATKALGLSKGGSVYNFATGGKPEKLAEIVPKLDTVTDKASKALELAIEEMLNKVVESIAKVDPSMSIDDARSIAEEKVNPKVSFGLMKSAETGDQQAANAVADAQRKQVNALVREIRAIDNNVSISDARAAAEQRVSEAWGGLYKRVKEQEAVTFKSRMASAMPTLGGYVGSAMDYAGNAVNNIRKRRVIGNINALGSGLAGQPGFMASMALGMMAGQGENIFGKETGKRGSGFLGSENALTAAGMEAGTTTLSAGLATASSLAMIPGVGPFAAGLTVAVSAVQAWSNAVEAGKQAVLEFQQGIRTKGIEDAADKTSKAYANFEKNPSSLQAQNALLDSISKESTLRQQDTTEKYKAIGQKAEFSDKVGYSDSFWSIFGYDTVGDRKVAKMEAMRQTSKDQAKAAEPLADMTNKFIDSLVRSGKSLEDIGKDPRLSSWINTIAQADESYQTAIRTGDTAAAANIKAQLTQKALTDANRVGIEKTALAAKAMDDANRAGRDLAMSFDRMSSSFNQSLGRVTQELENFDNISSVRSSALTGNAAIGKVSSRDSNILRNPKAYSENERNAAMDRASSMFGKDKDVVKKMLGINATDFGQSVKQAVQTDLRGIKPGEGNANLSLEDASKTARKNLEGQLANAPDNVRQEILTKFDAIVKNVAQNTDGQTAKQKVDALIKEIDDQLGGAASDAAKQVQEMALAVLDFRTNAMNSFIESVNEAAKAQREAQKLSMEAQDIRVRGNDSIRQALGLSAPEPGMLAARRDARVAQLTSSANNPRGLSSPEQIKNQILRDTAALGTLQSKLQELQNNSDPNNKAQQQEIIRLTTQMGQLTNNIENSKDALDELANNSEIASAALAKIKDIQQAMQGQGEFLDKLATATPEDADKLGQAFMRLQNNLNGNFNGPSMEANRTFLETLKTDGPIAAQRAAMSVMAQQRRETLSLFKELIPVLMAQRLNQGVPTDLISKEINELTARLYQGVYGEAGLYNNPMTAALAQQQVGYLRNPVTPQMMGLAGMADNNFATQAAAKNEQASIAMVSSSNTMNNAAVRFSTAIDKFINTYAIVRKADNESQIKPPPQQRSKGGLIYASKGQLVNFQSKGTDTVPAMLTPGEFVVNAKSASQHLPLLKSINSGSMNRGGLVYLADGGTVKKPSRHPLLIQYEKEMEGKAEWEKPSIYSWLDQTETKEGSKDGARYRFNSSERKAARLAWAVEQNRAKKAKEQKQNPVKAVIEEVENRPSLSRMVGSANLNVNASNNPYTSVLDSEKPSRVQSRPVKNGELSPLVYKPGMRGNPYSTNTPSPVTNFDNEKVLGSMAAFSIGAGKSILPGAASLPAAAYATSATAPFMGPFAIIPGLAAGLVTSYVTDKVQEKALDKFAPRLSTSMKETQETYPDANMTGQVLGGIASGRLASRAIMGATNRVTSATQSAVKEARNARLRPSPQPKPIPNTTPAKPTVSVTNKPIRASVSQSSIYDSATNTAIDELASTGNISRRAAEKLYEAGYRVMGDKIVAVPNTSSRAIAASSVAKPSVSIPNAARTTVKVKDLGIKATTSSRINIGKAIKEFNYEAVDKTGQNFKGIIRALNEKDALTAVKDAGLIFSKLAEKAAKKPMRPTFAKAWNKLPGILSSLWKATKSTAKVGTYASLGVAGSTWLWDRFSNRNKPKGMSNGGIVYASNGQLIPYESKGTDTIPAMLTPGEFVVNKKAASKHLSELHAINKGYYKGGVVNYLKDGGLTNNRPQNEDARKYPLSASTGDYLVGKTNNLINLLKQQNPDIEQTLQYSKKTNDTVPNLLSKKDFDKKIVGTIGKASGGIVYASQGQLVNFQPKGTDTVPAMLTPGEFVVNAKSTAKHLPLLQKLNGGGTVYAQNGGYFNPFTGEIEETQNLAIARDKSPILKHHYPNEQQFLTRVEEKSDPVVDALKNVWSYVTDQLMDKTLRTSKNKGGTGTLRRIGIILGGKTGGKLLNQIPGVGISSTFISGALTAWSEGSNILEGALLGAITGDTKTGGVLGDLLGLDAKTTTGKIFGVIGSMMNGAILGGGTFGLPGAIIGSILGGAAEFWKIFKEKTTKTENIKRINPSIIKKQEDWDHGLRGGGSRRSRWRDGHGLRNPSKQPIFPIKPRRPFDVDEDVNVANPKIAFERGFSHRITTLKKFADPDIEALSRIYDTSGRLRGNDKNNDSILDETGERFDNTKWKKTIEWAKKAVEEGKRGVIDIGHWSNGGLIYASEGTLVPYAPKGTDTVPAMLTPGEFVINREATRKHLPLLKSINNGTASKAYSQGGIVYLARGGQADNFVGNYRNLQIAREQIKGQNIVPDNVWAVRDRDPSGLLLKLPNRQKISPDNWQKASYVVARNKNEALFKIQKLAEQGDPEAKAFTPFDNLVPGKLINKYKNANIRKNLKDIRDDQAWETIVKEVNFQKNIPGISDFNTSDPNDVAAVDVKIKNILELIKPAKEGGLGVDPRTIKQKAALRRDYLIETIGNQTKAINILKGINNKDAINALAWLENQKKWSENEVNFINEVWKQLNATKPELANVQVAVGTRGFPIGTVIPKFNKGGVVYANNGALISAQKQGNDTVPAMLTPGEFVVNRNMTQKHMPVLQAINKGYYNQGGMIQYLNNGGVVGPKYYNIGGGVNGTPAAARSGNGVNNTGSAAAPDWLSTLDEKVEKISSSLQESLDGMFSNLSNVANQLQNTAQELPREMSITSNVNKNVNINGISGEWNKYQGDILKMAGEHAGATAKEETHNKQVALSKWSEGQIPVIG